MLARCKSPLLRHNTTHGHIYIAMGKAEYHARLTDYLKARRFSVIEPDGVMLRMFVAGCSGKGRPALNFVIRIDDMGRGARVLFGCASGDFEPVGRNCPDQSGQLAQIESLLLAAMADHGA
ncbi:MAG: hypothetical protein RLZZ08_295 [Pseudomonadota bacterium]|jgi:hypothetical protein